MELKSIRILHSSSHSSSVISFKVHWYKINFQPQKHFRFLYNNISGPFLQCYFFGFPGNFFAAGSWLITVKILRLTAKESTYNSIILYPA